MARKVREARRRGGEEGEGRGITACMARMAPPDHLPFGGEFRRPPNPKDQTVPPNQKIPSLLAPKKIKKIFGAKR